LLESIERFFRRLSTYTQILPAAALDETVVKIMTELLSSIALVTKGLKKEGSSMSILVDVLCCSMEQSEIHKQTFWKEGR